MLMLSAAIFASCVGAAYADPASDYGRVVINNFSERAGMPAVVFDHWLHRGLYTCRLCHVDVGFAMEQGATNINKAGNFNGYYCGACHNGRTRFGDKAIFPACSDVSALGEKKRCYRCHSRGVDDVQMEYDFAAFTKALPKKGSGNGIDWEQAEATGLVKPIDYIEGVSIKRPAIKPQEDFAIHSKSTWMTDVIFSHKKHAVWNGCEVCHPEIFPMGDKGSVQFNMLQIYDGEYCGVCHDKVAFPLRDCERCHSKPVQ